MNLMQLVQRYKCNVMNTMWSMQCNEFIVLNTMVCMQFDEGNVMNTEWWIHYALWRMQCVECNMIYTFG